MLFNESEIINLLIKLSEEEDFRLTIIEATKGAAMAGAGALFGALIAGPPGLVVGKIQFLIFNLASGSIVLVKYTIYSEEASVFSCYTSPGRA